MELIIYIVLLITLFICLINDLGIFQQNHYHIKTTLYNLKKHYLLNIRSYFSLLLVIFCVLYTITSAWFLGISMIITSFGVISFTEKLVIKLKITKRIFRQLVTSILIISVFLIFKIKLALTLIIFLSPIFNIVCYLINLPFELLINKYFIKIAKNNLLSSKAEIIAITGSYGKTSIKNYIATLLKENYLVVATPKSYNTELGICKTINESLTDLTEYFVVEMGATKVGDIKQLTEFIKPKIAIIASIGPQHYETFKTIDNIIKEKCEVIKSENLEFVVINIDDQYLSKLSFNNSKIITVGINNSLATYNARNVSCDNNIIEFDTYKNNDFLLKVRVNLSGKHNVTNILISVATLIEMKIPIDIIKKGLFKIEPTLHRLSYRKDNNITIIDDSFNSNIIGMKNALDVLKNSKNLRLLITPGLVDLGILSKTQNQEIAFKILKSCDYVILINNQMVKYIEEIFIKQKFNNYQIMNSFKEAYYWVKHAYNKEPITLLIANDLPDNYLRR